MKLRCGLIGAGEWMRSALLPALQAQPGLEIMGCVAASGGEALAFVEEEGVGKAFDSVEAMLGSRNRPDLVVIATPDHTHADTITAALRAGVAAYCEKPLANDLATAREVARLGDETGVAATVGFSFRFNPALRALKRDLVAGRLGEPWLVEIAEHNPQFHPAGGKPMNWKGDPAQAGGGALFEYGSHAVDLAAWLVGPIARVSSTLKRVLPGARLDDIATVQMEFACGAAGLLVASWVLSGGFPGIRVRLHGSEALAEVRVDDRLPGGQRYVLSDMAGQGRVEQAVAAIEGVRTDAPRRHLAAFLMRLAGGRGRDDDILPTLGEATHVQGVLEAALKATTAWQTVEPA